MPDAARPDEKNASVSAGGPGGIAHWIGVDWGTTHLRATVLGEDGAVLAEYVSGDGTSRLGQDGFEPALLDLVGAHLAPDRATPVVACGAVGSRQDWQEAPYRSVPCAPVEPDTMVEVPTADPRISLRIVPGLCQSAPADVMRGEETQIAGFLARHPGWDGVLCLPGTHSKWAQLSAGEVVSFQTFMTGELFALLGGQSVLRHGIAAEGWDDAAFRQGLEDAQARPERLAAQLFRLRAETLLRDLGGTAARARLSGLLIGAELAAARPYWLGQEVVVIGASEVAEAYRAALATQGLRAAVVSGRDAALAGLAVAAGLLRGRAA